MVFPSISDIFPNFKALRNLSFHKTVFLPLGTYFADWKVTCKKKNVNEKVLKTAFFRLCKALATASTLM